MFKLIENESNTFQWPVKLVIPRSNDKPVNRKFKAEFKYTPQDEIDSMVEMDSDEDILDQKLEGWSEFVDAKGIEIKYDKDNRAQALNTPYIRGALLEAYFKGLAGRKGKN